MATRITIDIDGDGHALRSGADAEKPTDDALAKGVDALAKRVDALAEKHEEFVRQQGDHIAPFPKSKIGGYISHFRIVIELNVPGMEDNVVSITSPAAAQSVSWSDPFIYRGPDFNHRVKIPLPAGSTLPDAIEESDFIERPSQFFKVGRETLWLQILNLDARMESRIGDVRIILGETVKREYPDIFKPSLGISQSLGSGGFPANLFFNPYAIVETPMGAFRAVHGVLSYGRVTAFPPIGTPVSISSCIPLHEIGSVRASLAAKSRAEPLSVGRIVALSHPIDMEMQLPGEEAYQFVDRQIASAKRTPPKPA
jgi:hypothetical protein